MIDFKISYAEMSVIRELLKGKQNQYFNGLPWRKDASIEEVNKYIREMKQPTKSPVDVIDHVNILMDKINKIEIGLQEQLNAKTS